MKYLIRAFVLIVALSAGSHAQSDWHTYPMRSISDIIKAHTVEESKNVDIIISADPFPSKTVVKYTGKHRLVNAETKFFIDLWVQTRDVSPENANMLVEEYLFKERDLEYWLPVHKLLAPYIEKELKEGDEITVYYFFLGGYNEKKLREKKEVKTELNSSTPPGDKIVWIFAVEEFQKPDLTTKAPPTESTYVTQPLTAAIDKSLEGSGNKPHFIIDARQVKSKSNVVYTGNVRNVADEKMRFLKLWLESRGLPAKVIELLQQEVLFREGDKEYWLPVRKMVLADMMEKVKKGETIVVHTILAGGAPQGDSLEWVFVVGEYSK